MMRQRIPAHARPLASPRVFGAAEQRGSARTGASPCLGRSARLTFACLQLGPDGSDGYVLCPLFSYCVQHMETGCFCSIFPPKFDPPAVTEGFIYPGWSKEQHTLT